MMVEPRTFGRLAFAALLAVLLAAPLSVHAQTAQQPLETEGIVAPGAPQRVSDPLEPLNRVFFGINEGLDHLYLRPIALTYNFLVPAPARQGVRNALDNFFSPITLANDILQGEASRAGVTALRFVVNSTVGLLGIFDVAEEIGYPGHTEDFGQTLAVWGLDSGPYLVLPVLGPSNVRDVTGRVADGYMDPWTYVADNNDLESYLWGMRALNVVDRYDRNRKRIEQLRRDSLDFYATVRSLYMQNRRAEIRNQRVGQEDLSVLPSYEFTEQ